MASHDSVVIVAAARTPMGGFQGELSSLTAPELGAIAIKEVVTRSTLKNDDIDEVIMGNVLSAGLRQGPARQAMRLAGLPDSTAATTVNKLCGSGMKAAMIAYDSIKAGSIDAAIAGGMESMTNAPHLLPKARQGYRMGHGDQLKDHMFFDGLEDAETGKLMGAFAQDMADSKGINREQMDDYAIRSLRRAQKAITEKLNSDEIVPVTISTRKGDITVSQDEQPFNADLDKIPKLRPAFKKDGTITAANASSISDGASALILMRESVAIEKGATILARITSHSTQSQHPSEFTAAPCGALEKLLKKTGWAIEDVDLFEINEAFAMVAMMPINEFNIDEEKVNIYGGACAQGHPVGSTGSRLVVTLINALKNTGGKKGIAALCIGGGEATAMAIELV